MRIEKTKLPDISVLNSNNAFKFIDGYKADFIDKEDTIDIQKIGKLFFSTGPVWIDQIVKLLGLKTSAKIADKEKQLEKFNCEPNERIGLFCVFNRSENEVILGENDKHLDFRVSLFLERNGQSDNKRTLIISTSVKFNNRFGKLYFIPVKPFHKFIVPTMLKSMIKNINKEINSKVS